ncbi:pyridoxal 5'-phosphate synthase glutaminase subunit PdxT [Sulfolobales archaeon HS-7]|nr:pyridoxal 5'-phosphate synthase glutaminase subunit PdxT [Sulfolobales archaeon HS-7]
MKIGIISYQGSFQEHFFMMKKAMTSEGVNGDVIYVKSKDQLEHVDALIIPGGESTTIWRMMNAMSIANRVKEKIEEGIPVLGTCAGAILLSKESIDNKVKEKQFGTLGTMDIAVIRNYYGRQRESFQSIIKLENYGELKTVFIRAPAIVKIWGDTNVIAKLDNVVVAAMERNMIATTFHPELSDNDVVHRLLIRLAKK